MNVESLSLRFLVDCKEALPDGAYLSFHSCPELFNLEESKPELAGLEGSLKSRTQFEGDL